LGRAPSERESGAVPTAAKSTIVVGAFSWFPCRYMNVLLDFKPRKFVTSRRLPRSTSVTVSYPRKKKRSGRIES
jgi:hypothetical protein